MNTPKNFKYSLVFSLVLISLLCIPTLAAATTYYVDFVGGDDSNSGTSKSTPWKRCPGMVGFAGSYTHAAGDIFTFKGGVTWPSAVLPLTIGYSGTSGNIDEYTVDETWYSGGSWTRPTFDAEQTDDKLIINTNRDYIKFNQLNLINPANQVADTNPMFTIYSSNYVTVQNSRIDGSGGAGDANGFWLRDVSYVTIDNNYIEARRSTQNPDCILVTPWWNLGKHLVIKNNELTSSGSVGGADGIHIDMHNASNPGESNQDNCGPITIEDNNFHDNSGKWSIIIIGGINDLTIQRNIFHGYKDNGGVIAFHQGNQTDGDGIEYYFENVLVCNNLFYKITATTWEGWSGSVMINLDDDSGGAGNNRIYNNTFYQDGSYPGLQAGIRWVVSSSTKWSIKNNIFVGLKYSIHSYIGVSPILATITHNCFYNNENDPHMGNSYVTGDPKFVDAANDDFHLQADSPCKGTGESGVDMGAYGVAGPEPDEPDSVSYDVQVRNRPNPFCAGKEVTLIEYNLKQPSSVTITIYDLLGQEVWRESYRAGENGGKEVNSVPWDGRNLSGKVVANGGYICRIWIKREKRYVVRKIAVAK